jgi:hypothetical protein
MLKHTIIGMRGQGLRTKSAMIRRASRDFKEAHYEGGMVWHGRLTISPDTIEQPFARTAKNRGVITLS